MGLGAKIKDALHGDKNRKDTHQYSKDTQQEPGAYPSDEVPRHNDANERWYGTGSQSDYDKYDLNEPISQDSEYTYGYDSKDMGALDQENETTASRTHGLRKPAQASTVTDNPTSHRKSLSKDSTRAKEGKGAMPKPAPYWGDAMNSSPSQRKKDTYDMYNNDGAHERFQGQPRDERMNMPSKSGNDSYDMYHPDGAHEKLQGRPRDERRAMMGSNDYDIQPSARGQTLAGAEPVYNTVDRTRRSQDMSGNSSVASSSGMRAGMGDDHFGPGHAGARVLHRCEHCGNDSDISRYFRKDATYRMN